MSALRDTLVVAVFEIRASLRSRKALLLLLLYLAGAMAASGGFVSLLSTVEQNMADTLQVARTEKPGTMTASIMESEELRNIVTDLVGDEDLAMELVRTPPLALFYGWVAFTFVPVLVTLTSSDAIASDVDSGAARFALTRTTRGAWASGKLLGQAGLMASGVLLGAVGSWAIGFGWMNQFPAVDTAVWMARLSGRACVGGFAYLGLALGISQLVRSANKARALSLLGLVAIGAVRQLLAVDRVRDLAPAVADSLAVLFPGSHTLDLWQPHFVDRLPATLILLALGGTFFFVGHAWFVRRDA